MGSYLGNQRVENNDTADLTILRFPAKGTPNSRPKREAQHSSITIPISRDTILISTHEVISTTAY